MARGVATYTDSELVGRLATYIRWLKTLSVLAVVVLILGVVMLFSPVNIEALTLPLRFCAVIAILVSLGVLAHCRSMRYLKEHVRRVNAQ